MEEKWNCLCQELKRAIDHIDPDLISTQGYAEEAYRIGIDCWAKVKDRVREEGFRSEDEEIDFFSGVKPQFTGHCEFFLLAYQYYLLSPADSAEIPGYIDRELAKIDRFRETQKGFVGYYRIRKKYPLVGQHYFLRRTFDAERRVFARPYDINPDYFTNGDWILTQVIGNLRYQRFLYRESRRLLSPR